MAKRFVYHYTNFETLNDILDVSESKSYGVSGLHPISRFIRLEFVPHGKLPEKAFDGAIFAMPDRFPQSYLTHHWFGPDRCFMADVINNIRGCRDEIVRLRVCLSDEGDDACVADWGVHMHPDFNGPRDNPQELTEATKIAYFNSLTPLWDESVWRRHKIPEIVCFTPVLKDQISVDAIFDRKSLLQEIEEKRLNTLKTNKKFMTPPRGYKPT